MSQVWIASPGGQVEGPCDEQALRERSARGELAPGTLYWREGMSERRPVAELLGPPAPPWQAPPAPPPSPYAAPPEADAAPPGPRIAFAHDPANLTRWLVGLLWATVAIWATGLLDFMLLWPMLGRPYTEAEAAAADLRSSFLALLMLVVFPATAVTFLCWVHRAGVNVRAFGAQGLRTSPGWAVGYYFVPILNLWRPYQAMKEIAQASVDPRRWTTALAPSVIGWWWGFLLTHNWVTMTALRAFGRTDSVLELQTALVGYAASCVTGVIFALTAMTMVKAVHAAQCATVDRGG